MKKDTAKQKMSAILVQGILPLCIYYLVNQCVVIVGMSAIATLFTDLQTESSMGIYLRTAVQMAGMFLAGASMISYFKRENMLFNGEESGKGKGVLSLKSGVMIVLLGAVISLGINFLFSILGLLQSSESYNQVAGRQFSLPFWLAFCFYGIVSPWAEEIAFRGVFYRVLRRNVPEIAAVFGSALLFGAFHGNIVQLLYGSIMGAVMALIYEKFQNLLAPILFHGAANTAIYAVTYFF